LTFLASNAKVRQKLKKVLFLLQLCKNFRQFGFFFFSGNFLPKRQKPVTWLGKSRPKPIPLNQSDDRSHTIAPLIGCMKKASNSKPVSPRPAVPTAGAVTKV
jgi:hypothetical protein